jgi:hypothetical protein
MASTISATSPPVDKHGSVQHHAATDRELALLPPRPLSVALAGVVGCMANQPNLHLSGEARFQVFVSSVMRLEDSQGGK